MLAGTGSVGIVRVPRAFSVFLLTEVVTGEANSRLPWPLGGGESSGKLMAWKVSLLVEGECRPRGVCSNGAVTNSRLIV